MRFAATTIFFVLSAFAFAPLYAANEDVFSVQTEEGVEMTFKVISESKKTCQVGTGYSNPCVTSSSTGVVSIPASANGYAVTSIGYKAFYGCSGLTTVNIPNSVTYIGESAFQLCTSLSAITIPNSVTNIGWFAFSGCSGLTSVTIPNSITSIEWHVFDGCSGLTSVAIPNSVMTIRGFAFRNCSGLTSVIIPNGVTNIENSVFYGCSGLTSVIIPNGVTNIENSAFYNCSGLTSITIPNSVANIESLAFHRCSGLTSVTIPNSVKNIGNSAFADCSGLTSITIPNSVTNVENFAFQNCSGLTSVTIGSGVTRIGNDVFSGCSGLTSVTIGSGVTNIGQNAFTGCNGLKKVVVKDIAKWCEIAFDGSWANPLTFAHRLYSDENTEITELLIPNGVTSIGKYAFLDCYSLTAVTIPNSVTSIGQNAFERCNSLTSITIPNSVTSIGSYAFSDCSSLTNVNIPDKVTSIEQNVFYGCSGLTSITIPNSVTSIESDAFYGCSGLTSVTIPTSVTSIGQFAFADCCGLISFIVESGNNVYDSRDNCNAIIETKTNTLIAGCLNTVIPNSVTSIGSSAFSGCSGLTAIIIPNGVVSIRQYAFSGCSGLTTITIPNSMASIGQNAFSDCSGLKKVIAKDIAAWCAICFVNSVSNPLLYAHHFFCDENTEITEMFLPNNITSIGNYSFSGCSGLTSINIPKNVTSIGNSAFSGCSALTTVSINSNSIVSKTYTENNNFQTLFGNQVKEYIIGGDVMNIGECAFSGCSSLTSVTIPNNVTSIGDSAFSGCNSLTAVIIPNSVTSIGQNAFNNCSGLRRIFSERKEPAVIDDDVFSSPNSHTLYVPNGSSDKYREIAGWNRVSNIEEALMNNEVFTDFTKEGLEITFKVFDVLERKCQIGVDGVSSSAVKDNTASIITIPERVKDFDVTTICDEAFSGCSALKSISLPSTITTVGDGVLRNCNSLASIHWNADIEFPASAIAGINNPNLLLYVKNKSNAPSNVQNVIVNGIAEIILLQEASNDNNFYCPEEFTAKEIEYTHNYSMTSGYQTCQGWETIALPFDVTDIIHMSSIQLVPIKNWTKSSAQYPFWLYEYTTNGWQAASAIKGNIPYIICMPNNEERYDAIYNIKGEVTFKGTNVKVYASDNIITSKYNDKSFVPNYQNLSVNSSIYALNVNNLWDSYNSTDNLPGSMFVSNLRAIHPFEAYMTLDGSASREYIPIFEDGMPTDIPVIVSKKYRKDERWYTLGGQQLLSKPKEKGIYILNGHKTIIR